MSFKVNAISLKGSALSSFAASSQCTAIEDRETLYVQALRCYDKALTINSQHQISQRNRSILLQNLLQPLQVQTLLRVQNSASFILIANKCKKPYLQNVEADALDSETEEFLQAPIRGYLQQFDPLLKPTQQYQQQKKKNKQRLLKIEVMDCHLFGAQLKKLGWREQEFLQHGFKRVSGVPRQKLVASLKAFFVQQTQEKVQLLYYSGEAMQNDGSWVFRERNRPENFYTFSPKQFFDLWRETLNPPRQQRHLVLVLDCSYAHQWGEYVRTQLKMPEAQITVQSACGAMQHAFAYSHGSVFTQNLLKCLQRKGKIALVEAPLSIPHFFTSLPSKRIAYALTGLPILCNSYDQLRAVKDEGVLQEDQLK